MKRYVDGEEIELSDEPVRIDRLSDRLIVHAADGTFSAVAVRVGDAVLVSYRGRQYRLEKKPPRRAGSAAVGSGEIFAPMPGQVVAVPVTVGQRVRKGEVLIVLEAMKTQQPFTAAIDGTVVELPVSAGTQVSEGTLLAKIHKSADDT